MAKRFTDKMIVVGAIGILVYFLIWYSFKLPLHFTDDEFFGHIWIAWIVISSLLFGIGILIKIINSKKTSR